MTAAEVPATAELRLFACTVCGGGEDLKDRGMAPGGTYCAPCRKAMREPTAAPWTERLLLDRLRARHAKDTGNGPEWVYMEHVRSSSGFDVLNTIDALAMHLWRSRHHEVHAYEVKVSRGDFRRELADGQAKSATWRQWVEFFWIVAPVGVVTPSDLPQQWGLMVTRGAGLAIAKRPQRLQPRPAGYLPAADLPRDLIAPMLRAAVRTASRAEEDVTDE